MHTFLIYVAAVLHLLVLYGIGGELSAIAIELRKIRKQRDSEP